jgi:hypothetical protein
MKSFLKISFAATRGEVWELKIGCPEIKGMNDMLSDLLQLDTDFLINFLEFHISGQATVMRLWSTPMRRQFEESRPSAPIS